MESLRMMSTVISSSEMNIKIAGLRKIVEEDIKTFKEEWESQKKWLQQVIDDFNSSDTPISTVSMPRRKIRAHYEHMSEFETGRAIGLKEAGWSNRLIA
ncbi:hypothetical protein LAZ67_19002126 [Cordylochernes scorpioides]|uniref:Uncharacterized protein n=1 Tax=Cordylochernes scorpioides TaxID=51811 RepID=A0ABY6LIA9_9ARAC|nr:hypothetical protein LAZ67_19002126 [Cordylochernes scorpioides]